MRSDDLEPTRAVLPGSRVHGVCVGVVVLVGEPRGVVGCVGPLVAGPGEPVGDGGGIVVMVVVVAEVAVAVVPRAQPVPDAGGKGRKGRQGRRRVVLLPCSARQVVGGAGGAGCRSG